MFNNITKEALYKLSIFQVRAIAREVGVKAPASLRKPEMIEKIMAISTGKEKPHIRVNAKGRPAKPISGLNSFIEMFLPQENPSNQLFNETLAVSEKNASEEKLLEALNEKGEISKQKGIINILREGYGFIRTKFMFSGEDAFVSSVLIEKHKLKNGDSVNCVIKKLSNGRSFVNSIEPVNRNIAENIDFETEPAIYPNKKINFKNMNIINNYFPVGFGQRALIYGKDNIVLKNFIFNLYNNADAEKKMLLFDATPEEQSIYEKDENIICITKEASKARNETVHLLIESLKRKAENKENTLLFICIDATSIMLQGEGKNDISNIVDCITRSFKNTEKAGSITVITVMKNYQAINDINKAFNLILPLDTDLAMFNTDICLDLSKISIFRNDNLVDEKHFDILKKKVREGFNSKKEIASVINELNL